MIKREFKINFKSLLIWSSILISIFLIVFLVYPSIINSPEMKDIDEMMNMFPKEILKLFNMDISSMNSAYGWLKSEGFVFILLVIGSFAGITGTNILLKEESDKTIEYLNSLPISRNNILFSKVIVGVINIILMILIVGIFNYIGLKISGEFDTKQFILLSITPILSSIPIFFLCLFISTFTHKTKKVVGVGLGIVFISYILNALSTISSSVKFLKYTSIFTLADIRNVILNTEINIVMILISFVISVLFLVFSVIRYNKKELI